MAKTSIYLNFMNQTEEAFLFYKDVFQTEFSAPIMYMRDIPKQEGQPELPQEEQNAVMHVALPITGGVEIMGTDILKSMGHKLELGNNITINLQPDSEAEVDRLFALLSEGGTDVQKPSYMFWGDYWGTCLDKYNIRWMFDYSPSTS